MLNKSKRVVRSAVVLSALAMLTACTSVSDVDSAGKTAQPVFPEMSSAARNDGSFVNRDNLAQVKAGMTKAQLYELLGAPHFSEGSFGVKEWDYIFHFTKANKSTLTCQYKVLFDADKKAQSFYFQPANCMDQLRPAVRVAKVAPQPKAERSELSAEGLFAFGSATLNTNGVKAVNKLATSLKKDDLSGKRIIITGHTDRIGSEAANMKVSKARAEAVKVELANNGISSASIETRGVGDSEPRVFCPGAKSKAVIECLAPNRRMTVDVLK